MSSPPVTQGPAARRPGAGAGWAGPHRWPGACGPWPTGAREPGPPGAAWPPTMTTTTTCPITSRHAGPPGARAVRSAAAWWRRAPVGGRANDLRAASTTPIRRCRPATARTPRDTTDTTDTTRRPTRGCPGRWTRSRIPGRSVPADTTRAATSRVPALSAGTALSRPAAGATQGRADTVPVAAPMVGTVVGTMVGPLAGTAATPVRGAAGARPAREPPRVPVPGARIPSRTVTPPRRGTPPRRPADQRGRAGAAGPPVPPRAQPSGEARGARRATRTSPPR